MIAALTASTISGSPEALVRRVGFKTMTCVTAMPQSLPEQQEQLLFDLQEKLAYRASPISAYCFLHKA